MLQCLEEEAAVPDDGDILPSFWGSEVPLACQGPTRKRADRQAPSEDKLWLNRMVILLTMVATMSSSLSEGAWTVQCAGSLCASHATHVWFATRALSNIQDRVVRQWCRLWMMQTRLLKITMKK